MVGGCFPSEPSSEGCAVSLKDRTASCCMSKSNKLTYSPVVPQHTCFGSDSVVSVGVGRRRKCWVSASVAPASVGGRRCSFWHSLGSDRRRGPLGILIISVGFAANPFIIRSRRFKPLRGKVEEFIDLAQLLNKQVVEEAPPEDVARTTAKIHEAVERMVAEAGKTS